MKKNSVRLIIALLLATLLVCSCGTADSPEVFEGVFDKTSAEYDLDGYRLIYYCSSDGSLRNYKEDTYFYEQTWKRVAEVEKTYNCTVDVRIPSSDIMKEMIASTSGGMRYCDAFSYAGDVLNDAAAAGVLLGLSSVSDFLDITDTGKWASKYQHESIAYNDDVYGFVPGIWPELSYSEIGYFLVLYEDTIGKIGGTDPREYLESGTWVWSQFRKTLESFTKVEGSDTDVYALPYPSGVFAHMYISSNGSHLVDFDSEGNIINGFADSRAFKGMQEAVDVKNEYEYTFMREGVPGSVAMTTTDSNGLLKGIAFEVENFGIVSWPTGPDVEPGYAFSEHSNIRPTSISVLTPDQDASALILDRIYAPFEGYETMDRIFEFMNQSVFFDRRDCETFFRMVENTRYNYFHWNVAAWINEYLESDQTIMQSVETLENKLSYVIEKNIAPCVRGIIAVYGSYGN